MTTSNRTGVERAFLAILRTRHPDVTWIIRPGEGTKGNTAPAATGQVIGRFAVPEDQRPVGDGHVHPADAAYKNRIYSRAK